MCHYCVWKCEPEPKCQICMSKMRLLFWPAKNNLFSLPEDHSVNQMLSLKFFEVSRDEFHTSDFFVRKSWCVVVHDIALSYNFIYFVHIYFHRRRFLVEICWIQQRKRIRVVAVTPMKGAHHHCKWVKTRSYSCHRLVQYLTLFITYLILSWFTVKTMR
jgi:hypothetical protein